jgi:formate hydrogenlyase subunit 3/multisubunit Na+/H+ antiporter MnhD subunit
VLSTLEDFGFVMLGITVGMRQAMAGALTVAVVHPLGKALPFISLSTAEEDGNLGPERRGLASLCPTSGAAFLFGIFAVLGVPPLMGF